MDIHQKRPTWCSGIWIDSRYTGLNDLSWNMEEWFDHEKKRYQAKGFQFSGNIDYFYFVSIIDDDFEAFKVPRKGSWLQDHRSLSEEEVLMPEQVFSGLIDDCGWNKPFEERYAGVKASRIQKADLESFLTSLVPLNKPATQDSLKADVESISAEILECAKNPLPYFKAHEPYLVNELDIDEPVSQLFKYVLLAKLMRLEVVFAIDWKDSLEEIRPAIQTLSGINPFIGLPGAEESDTDTLLRHAAKIWLCEDYAWSTLTMGQIPIRSALRTANSRSFMASVKK